MKETNFYHKIPDLIKEMKGSKAEYRNIRWNSKGDRLATASDAFRIWSSDGQLLFTGKSASNLWGISWSPDQEKIITGDFENGKMKLWTGEGKILKEW